MVFIKKLTLITTWSTCCNRDLIFSTWVSKVLSCCINASWYVITWKNVNKMFCLLMQGKKISWNQITTTHQFHENCLKLTWKKWWDFCATWSAIFTSTESKCWANFSCVDLPWVSIWLDKESLEFWNKNGKILAKVSAFFKLNSGSKNTDGTWDRLSTLTDDLEKQKIKWTFSFGYYAPNYLGSLLFIQA